MKVRKEVGLTQSEWYVMDCLWGQAPQTVMQLAARLSQRVGWAKSTTITTLERMEAKGLVRSTPEGRGKQYHPCVRREEAVKSETRSFLDRVYRGSVGLVVSAMAEGRNAIQQRAARLVKETRPPKAALAAAAVLLALAAVLTFGDGTPPHTAAPGMRRPWRVPAPSTSGRRPLPVCGIPPQKIRTPQRRPSRSCSRRRSMTTAGTRQLSGSRTRPQIPIAWFSPRGRTACSSISIPRPTARSMSCPIWMRRPAGPSPWPPCPAAPSSSFSAAPPGPVPSRRAPYVGVKIP